MCVCVCVCVRVSVCVCVGAGGGGRGGGNHVSDGQCGCRCVLCQSVVAYRPHFVSAAVTLVRASFHFAIRAVICAQPGRRSVPLVCVLVTDTPDG